VLGYLPEQRHHPQRLQPYPLSPNAWHQLEVRVTINDANSQVQTWLDGQPLADLSRTESLGTSPIGRLQLGENIGGRSYELALDDLAQTP
jgi:hypothetical protein